MKNIGDIDKNLKIQTELGRDNIEFYNVKNEPFKIYGNVTNEETPFYKRLPMNVAKEVNEGVAFLATNTAGIRVRFATDSSYVAIKANIPPLVPMSHMPLSGHAGFDLYEDSDFTSAYMGSFMPPSDVKDSFEALIDVADLTSKRKMRYFTINFPLYNGVDELYVGIENDACIECGREYMDIPPIVYYGSSITQGGCASRPGNSYQSIISRKNSIDYINLGFSGSARGEDSICEYISNLKMSVFVSDYDYNSPTVQTLQETHSKLYKTVRAKNPTLPIILISNPDLRPARLQTNDNIMRRNIVHQTFIDGINSGDRNLYYIDGESLFDKENLDCSTVDGCHPNDFGFVHMAIVINAVINSALAAK